MCVLVAMGEAQNWEDAAARVVRWERHLEPDLATHSRYDEAYRLWLEVYQRMLPMADDGVLPSLWRAPGV